MNNGFLKPHRSLYVSSVITLTSLKRKRYYVDWIPSVLNFYIRVWLSKILFFFFFFGFLTKGKWISSFSRSLSSKKSLSFTLESSEANANLRLLV